MGVNSYQESVFFHYILQNPIFLNTAKPEFFSNPTLKDLFNIARDHTINYKEPPEKEQLAELARIKGLTIQDEVIAALYNSKKQMEQYGEKWLDDNVGPWIRMRNLEFVMRKSIAFMKTANVGAENAAEVVEQIRHMFSTETAIDFSFKIGNDFFDPMSHKQDRLATTPTGYPFIDKCLDGGWWKGALFVFLSGPKCGKSTWLGNLAAHSVYNGFNTAYITVELQKEIIAMRIGSNMLSIPMDEYKAASKDTDLMRTKLNQLQSTAFKPLGKFHIQEFPSSTMGTTDLRAYLVKAQEILGYKFENVFVDYINIMKNWRNPNTENLYMKIKQISEDLRAIAQEENWAIITATQTNRGGWDTSDLSIANVSESAALLHTVDGLFGIITNPEMKAQGLNYLKYLADRVSGLENTRKLFTFDRKFSRIEEDPNSQIEDMEYIMAHTVNNKYQKRGSTSNFKGNGPDNFPSGESAIAAKISNYPNPNQEVSLTGEPEDTVQTAMGLF
jgi:replicative DNA helicase